MQYLYSGHNRKSFLFKQFSTWDSLYVKIYAFLVTTYMPAFIVLRRWEKGLGTSHLPEMVFGGNSLCLLHQKSGFKIHFNAFDALKGWKQESLPPVEVPAAAKWKFRW